jgi:hypothetical protein
MVDEEFSEAEFRFVRTVLDLVLGEVIVIFLNRRKPDG